MANGGMDPIVWLMWTGIIIWLGLGVYVAFLALAQRGLRRRFRQLEMLRDENND